uniref:Transcription termination factor 1 n=1 Tax=Calidris pygmaea TaxID=425635 RepID=A0A8C3K2R8_9CHAR
MTEEASADDFQVQTFLKKKKKRKRKEYNKKHENDEGESIENAEPSRDSPLLFEDRAAQNGEGCKKKKKKHKEKMQQSLLDNSCVGLECEISDETGVDASQKKKKKKKKKRKYNNSTDDHSDVTCVVLNHHNTDSCQQIDADYIYLKQPAKKKRKEKLPEGDEACELPTSETGDKNDNKKPKKKRKKKKKRKPLGSNRKKDPNSSCTEMADSDKLSVNDEEFINSTMCSVVDLDVAKQELEEFIPHVRNISDSSIRKMAGRDLVRFKQFKKQGIAVKFGRFSQKENNQIRKNIEEFLLITGIDSAEKLLFTSRYPEDKETIKRLKAEHCFCEKISEGIPRPWRLIYYRARKMFDPNNYKGRYSKEEKEKLKKYHALHGNDWKKISELMSRSNLSVAMKYSEIKSAANYGPWSKEETQRLMHAVEEVIRKRMEKEDANSLSSLEKSHREVSIDREMLYQKLPWTEIEAKVGTRYWRQCKQKWTAILTNKMTKGQQLYRGTKGLQAKISVIKRYKLHFLIVPCTTNSLNSSLFRDVPKAYVQAKFYKLKVSCVPLWQKKTFSEIIDYLFEEKLPELEEQLEKRKGKCLSSDNSTAGQQQKAFRLGDIFDSSEDSD